MRLAMYAGILTNLALLGVGAFMLGLQRLFFGTLRPIEVEQLYEKAWFAITETCLAMTIFREEVGAYFLVMFVCLLIGKVWGWIGEGRVEILEQQPPANPRLFHIRLSMSLLISTLFDLYMLLYSVQTVLQQARPNMMVVFAFEFAVLHVTSISTAARYTISLYEASVVKNQTKARRDQIRQERAQARRDAAAAHEEHTAPSSTEAPAEDDVDNLEVDVPGWEEKGRWVFYLDLATDFFKLVLYLTFFFVLCMFYGMPIHIIRDVALTIRSFYKRINDFVKYRQATRDMNDRYQDATPEEVAREDVCIICREEMRAWAQPAPAQNPTNANPPPAPTTTALDERTRPKKLPCGHILHFACLRSWLERQQICPTCRRPVLAPDNPASATGPNAPNPNAGAAPAPNQHQVAHVPQQAGHGPGVHQNVFNFGPFRLAFGARIGRGVPPPINNIPAAPNRPQLPGAFQGVGNPFGFFGQNQAPQQQTNARFTPINVSAQLHQIEQQLMREVNSLRAQSDQLYLIRALQGELARLRIQQAQGNHGPLMNGTITNPQRPLNVGWQGFQPTAIPSIGSNQPLNMAQAFTSGQQPQIMGPGHADLPPGMTLPQGWTVTQLQRLAPAGGNVTEMPTASSSSQQPTSSPTPVISTENQAGTSSNIVAPTPTVQQSNTFASPIPPSSSTPLASSSPQPPASITSGPPTTSQAPDPPSSDVPQWGSAPPPPSNELAEDNNEIRVNLPSTSMNGNAAAPRDATANADPSSEAKREAKGKGKAVTIEDSAEDVD
ncbi:MAG: hypothetical protein Q9195_004426 [Heterodermia aff. obscurata]